MTRSNFIFALAMSFIIKETQNLIDNYPEIEILLEKVLDSHRKQRKNYFSPESEFPGWLDEETRQRLIREGYF